MTMEFEGRPQIARGPGGRRASLAAIASFVVVALLLITSMRVEAQDKTGTASGLPTITVVRPERSEITSRVVVSGTMLPREEVLIYPSVSGHAILSINVDIGDSVEEGEVLATLNDRTLTAQLAQAEAELRRARASERQARSEIVSARALQKQAEAALLRNENLRASGTISVASLEQAVADSATAKAGVEAARGGLAVVKAQAEQAEAQRDIAQLNLDYARIKAPVPGLISERNAQLGAIANSGGDPLFRIIRGGIIELEAEIIETDLGRVHVGDDATIEVAGVGRMTGEVRLISPTVDRTSRLGTARISFGPDERLRTGLFASGWITTESRASISLPTTAVLSDEAGDYVLVSNDGVLARRDVVAGLIVGTRREIVRGLDESDTVVAKAGAFFQEGDRILPIPLEQDVEAPAHRDGSGAEP